MDDMKFAVIGGDMRQAKLAELLAADGHRVSAFALDKVMPEDVCCEESAQRAVRDARCVILPLPLTSKEETLNAPLSRCVHSTESIFSELSPGQVICAGRIDDETREFAAQYGLGLIDYYAREELIVLNAVATAEGAIQIAMEETLITMCGAKCLVIGFGRIGKILSHRLKGLGADVTVSARRYGDMAWIDAYGYRARNTEELDGKLSDFDMIFNTVPARVLDERRLREIDKECLCMDLASKPGGMDFLAASKLGLRAIWALSLPGEVAPVTSGVIIRDTIYNILREMG